MIPQQKCSSCCQLSAAEANCASLPDAHRKHHFSAALFTCTPALPNPVQQRGCLEAETHTGKPNRHRPPANHYLNNMMLPFTSNNLLARTVNMCQQRGHILLSTPAAQLSAVPNTGRPQCNSIHHQRVCWHTPDAVCACCSGRAHCDGSAGEVLSKRSTCRHSRAAQCSVRR
jgi:hypothetical protein